MSHCKSIGCGNTAVPHTDFCAFCVENAPGRHQSIETRHPERFKPVLDMDSIDAFAVLHLFGVSDPAGCIQHAVRNLLHTGPSPDRRAISEARDSLTRWLELNPH